MEPDHTQENQVEQGLWHSDHFGIAGVSAYLDDEANMS